MQHMQQCRSQRAESMVLVLVLVLMPMVWAQPYPIPPTCYTKVLNMGTEITQRAADIKNDYDTYRCAAHLPDLYIDVHNACVMSTMNSYVSLLGGLRERRCSYNRKVQTLAAMIRQLYIIISQKCHGDLVFTHDNCEALQSRGRRG
ncbi:CYTL1 domain-containing protein [Rhinichthys klamathensis goyatoka]|uniref:CYTL1 domain-containing protein n=1 Tax=Rhinichthys klamathensis goyatoka TaxID=3034132 RepID=UPI0024B5D654|nr:CYTL1 domain-containing protein [Rhinichthys klamathensis goyatoka]